MTPEPGLPQASHEGWDHSQLPHTCPAEHSPCRGCLRRLLLFLRRTHSLSKRAVGATVRGLRSALGRCLLGTAGMGTSRAREDRAGAMLDKIGRKGPDGRRAADRELESHGGCSFLFQGGGQWCLLGAGLSLV